MRTRGAAAINTATVDGLEDEDTLPTAPSLKFSESLSWRAGKPIATGELLRRLQGFSRELQGLEQGQVSNEALAKYAPDLVSTNILSHKDKGVRAWAACCLVDILRLCAPDAPFTTQQLKDVFHHFITRIIPSLDDAQSPYHGQHCHVVQSLSEFKSIVLLMDVPNPGALMLRLFSTCFDIFSEARDDLGKNVAYWLTGMLDAIVDEYQNLPSDVVDVILAQFMRTDRFPASGPATLLRQPSPAYIMAATLCNNCPDPMSRYVGQYFNNVIVDTTTIKQNRPSKPRPRKRGSSPATESDIEPLQGPSEEDIKQLEKAHRLLRELWKACSEVVRNVIPQIEAELLAENLNLRLLGIQAIGDLAAGIGSEGPPIPPVLDTATYPQPGLSLSSPAGQANSGLGPKSSQSFAQSYSSAYKSFLARKHDKSPIVRSAWTLKIGWILATSAGGFGLSTQEEDDLIDSINQMLVDSDEKVRLAAIQAISFSSFKDIVMRLGATSSPTSSSSLFNNLADRVKDRKHSVRAEAMSLLGTLWGSGVEELITGNEHIRALLGGVPSKIFEAVYVNDPTINALVDQVTFESLLPLAYPAVKQRKEQADSQNQKIDGKAGGMVPTADADIDVDRLRTERLLVLIQHLDQRAKTVFFAMLARPAQLSQVMATMLKQCEEYNGGVMDDREAAIKQHLHRLIEYFSKLFPDPTRAAEDLWKFAKMHDRRCYALIRFCMAPDSDYKKVYKSFRELKKRLAEKTGSSTTLGETMTLLMYKIANIVYNRSHVHSIISASQKDDEGLGQAANEVLREISSKSPAVFKVHGAELCHELEMHAPKACASNSTDVLSSLKACANFAKKFPGEVPKDRKFLQSMMQYAERGSPPRAAKYAVSIILSSPERRSLHAKDLAKHCIQNFKYGTSHFLTLLAALSQLTLLAADDLEDELDAIHDIAIQQVLENVRTQPLSDVEWDAEIDEECEAKIWALQILVNRLRCYKNNSIDRAMVEPVYKLLNTLIHNKGEISKSAATPLAHRSRLRLEAGIMHLKLCINRDFGEYLTSSAFDDLALLVQDPRFEVRDRFVNKIMRYLGQDRISSRFYTIVFLLAFDPSQKLKSQTTTWLRARASYYAKIKAPILEAIFARLLSLLAHHPDFTSTSEDLEDFVQYIMLYLKTVASADNLSFIYHVAQRLKAVQDKARPDGSTNLYILSDLAQAVIRQYEEFQGWSMQAFAGKARLPLDLFTPISNHEAAQEIANEQFLPEEVMDRLGALVKSSLRSNDKRNKRKPDAEQVSVTKKRALLNKSSENSKHKPGTSSKKKEQVKTPKPKAVGSANDSPLTARRTSNRTAVQKTYMETGDSEDDADMEQWNVEAGDESGGDTIVVQPLKGSSKNSSKANITSRIFKRQAKVAVLEVSDDELSDAPDSDEDGE